MPRHILDISHIHPAIHANVGGKPEHQQTVADIKSAIAQHAIVVVGMRQNPFPKKARELLDTTGQRYHYMEYGSYLSEWKLRGAIKMWTGWQTFPMIFINGLFVGGFSDLKSLIDTGEFSKLLAAAPAVAQNA